MNLEETPFNSDMKSPSNPYKTYWNAIIIAQNTNVNITPKQFLRILHLQTNGLFIDIYVLVYVYSYIEVFSHKW